VKIGDFFINRSTLAFLGATNLQAPQMQISIPYWDPCWGSFLSFNRTAHIRQQCREEIFLSCHKCLINTGVEKNDPRINID
jgi:hypothetical protein